jgi:hypothetical protein
MSHRAQQRVLVRLLHDPSLLQRLREDPLQLRGLGLTEEEQRELVSIDIRALQTDPLRTHRVLQALVEEYKLSTTLLLAHRRRFAVLESFFQSAHFHKAVQGDRALVMAFGAFLIEQGPLDGLAELVSYERAFVEARRGVLRPHAVERLEEHQNVCRVAGVSVLRARRDLIAMVQQLEKYLFAISLVPQQMLCEDVRRLEAFPREEGKERCWLVSPSVGGAVSIVTADAGLAVLLEFLAQPHRVRECVPLLAKFGVPARNVGALLASLCEEGLLQQARK